MKTARIDIKEEDFDIKHKTKSQYNGPYTPKSMILGGWEHWRQEDSRSIPFSAICAHETQAKQG